MIDHLHWIAYRMAIYCVDLVMRFGPTVEWAVEEMRDLGRRQ